MKKAELDVQELKADNILAGVIIGGDWVQMFLVHMDALGASYMIRSESAVIPTAIGCAPDIRSITTALGDCWQRLEAIPGIDYGRFMLCLPPWGMAHRSVSADTELCHDKRIPFFRRPEVSERDVCRLVEKASQLDDPHHVTVDLFPGYFQLESGRRVTDPVGETTAKLGYRADAVKAERGLVEGILDGLGSFGIKVDVMTSMANALGGSLCGGEEDQSGVAVLHAGRRYCTLSIFDHGELRCSSSWEGGSEAVLTMSAQRMNITRDAVVSVIEGRDRFLSDVDSNDPITSLPLWDHAQMRQSPIARNLEREAWRAVMIIVRQVKDVVGSALIEQGVNVKRFVVVGEDKMSPKLLKQLLEEEFGVYCRIGKFPTVEISMGMQIMGYAPTMGVVRRYSRRPPVSQCFLDRYNEPMFDGALRRGGQLARSVAWSASLRFVDRLSRKETPDVAVEQKTEPVAAIPAVKPVAPRTGTPQRRPHKPSRPQPRLGAPAKSFLM